MACAETCKVLEDLALKVLPEEKDRHFNAKLQEFKRAVRSLVLLDISIAWRLLVSFQPLLHPRVSCLGDEIVAKGITDLLKIFGRFSARLGCPQGQIAPLNKRLF